MNYLYRILGVLVLTGSLLSCDDKLYLEPISQFNEETYFSKTSEVEKGLIAVYDALQAVPVNEYAVTELRSDNSRQKGENVSGLYGPIHSFTVDASNRAVYDYWVDSYNVIFRANTVLKYIDAVEDSVTALRIGAEAKSLRALSHFNLVRVYGDVPYIDRVVLNTDTDLLGNVDKETTLDLIEEDLIASIPSLLSKGETESGRFTKAAGQTLLAKVYMNRHKYDLALPLIEAVIDDGNYSLEDDYADVFYNEENDETIFAIQYIDDDANNGQRFSYDFTKNGAGVNYATDDFVSTVVTTFDTVRQETLFSIPLEFENRKFVSSSEQSEYAGNDWIVFRYADVLLMRAEAILGTDDESFDLSAINAYNEVRARASMPELPVNGFSAITKQDILDERRIELAFENHRFFDLVRFNRTDILEDYANSVGFTFAPKDLLMPIPGPEINTLPEGVLMQNIGY